MIILLVMLGCDRPAPDGKLLEVSVLMDAGTTYKIIDFRPSNDYQNGHIPGAVNLWRHEIQSEQFPYTGMIASKNMLESKLGSLGISSNDQLIVYDDRGSCEAARFWWTLKSYGFDNVSILNGGLQSWKRSGGTIETGLVDSGDSQFSLPSELRTDLLISHQDLENELNTNPELILLDVRSLEEYTGSRRKEGATKAGRIPGSKHLDWEVSFLKKDCNRIKDIKDLEEVYAEIMAFKDKPIVAYCHSGVRSAHTTFVLKELLGFTNVRNYDGSWVEWSYLGLPSESDYESLN